MAIYGIDLGTTYCSVAWSNGGIATLVALERGGVTLASLACLNGAANPSVSVGTRALRDWRALVGESERAPAGVVLVRGSKSHMADDRACIDGPPWSLGDKVLWSTDVAAILLRTLMAIVRASPGLPSVDGVVVTHPQRFRNREKIATAQAASMAGVPLLGMITEPDAAAWAYGMNTPAHDGDKTSRTFMVFDFGGGTLDVTVMRSEPGSPPRLRAIDSYGIQLGGLAIDSTVRDVLFEQYRQKSGDGSLHLGAVNDATRERLLELAEWFKITLNTDAASDPAPMGRTRKKLFVPVFNDDEEGEEIELVLSLGEFSRAIAGELDRAMACADEALKRAGMTWAALDEVLLTGGSSLLWAVRKRMQERCGVVRSYEDPGHPLNPLTIVASGAAMHGAAIESHGTAGVDLRGVVPDHFSVRAWRPDASAPNGRSPVLEVLVPAGTATPFVGHKTFTRRGDGNSLTVEVWEGRTEREATRVGEYTLGFDSTVGDGTKVEVTLDVKGNGELVLSVIDRATGAVRNARLDDSPGVYSAAELAKRTDWLRTLRLAWDG